MEKGLREHREVCALSEPLTNVCLPQRRVSQVPIKVLEGKVHKMETPFHLSPKRPRHMAPDQQGSPASLFPETTPPRPSFPKHAQTSHGTFHFFRCVLKRLLQLLLLLP